MQLVLALSLTIFSLGGWAMASEQDAQSINSTVRALTSSGIQIVSPTGQPLSGASVMVGTAPNVPFEGNVVRTDNQGFVPSMTGWIQALPMTVEAPGFVRTTFNRVEPYDGLYEVSLADGPDRIQVRGEAKEFGRLKKDGRVDFAMVIPAMTRRQLLNFDISAVLSPEVDTLRIAGRKMSVPSNLSLPKQRESYIIPITINKPVYRMFVRRPGFYRMAATHGQFPLKKVVNDLRDGKSIFDVINYFNFKESGQLSLKVDKSVDNQDIAVNQVPFKSTTTVTAPRFEAGNVMLSLALHNQAGYLYPSDIKRLKPSESMSLAVAGDGSDSLVLSVLTPDTEPSLKVDEATRLFTSPLEESGIIDLLGLFTFGDQDNDNEYSVNLGRLSFVVQSAQDLTKPKFLSYVERPRVESGKLALSTPQPIQGVTPIATLVIFSEVEKIQSGKIQSEKRTRLWELMASAWLDQMTLPEVALKLDPKKSYRWEVMYLGRKGDVNFEDKDTDVLDAVTHVTRNSTDI